MKEIGELLKQKRLEKGYTIDEVSDKTRLSIPHIKAIEAGNVDYFKNDLPYLRYFLRSYCELVDVEFDSIKDQLQDVVEEYTHTFSIKSMEEHKKIEEHVRTHNAEQKKTQKSKKRKSRQHIDFSLISFLTIVIIVIASVIFVAGFFILRNMQTPLQPNPPIVTPTPSDQVPDPVPVEPEPDPEPEATLNVSAKDATTYVISGYGDAEELTLTVEFVPRAWFQATKDGVVLSDPTAKIYESGETLQLKLNPSVDKVLDLRIGYFAGMKFKVNDVEVKLDDSIANTPGSLTISFEIGGKSSESAE